jgi:hypothetical protein
LARHLRAYQAAQFLPCPAADAALLGTMQDAESARRLGRTRDEVNKERRGVPRFRKASGG